MSARITDLREAFEERVVRGGEGDCWGWTGSMQVKGYARIGIHDGDGVKREILCHRLAYELFVGEIPGGLVIDHLCRNRGCVNPAHLEPVTQEENVRRGEWAPVVLPSRNHCDQGHEYTPENTYIRKSGARECRTCSRAAVRAYRRRKADGRAALEAAERAS